MGTTVPQIVPHFTLVIRQFALNSAVHERQRSRQKAIYTKALVWLNFLLFDQSNRSHLALAASCLDEIDGRIDLRVQSVGSHFVALVDTDGY